MFVHTHRHLKSVDLKTYGGVQVLWDLRASPMFYLCIQKARVRKAENNSQGTVNWRKIPEDMQDGKMLEMQSSRAGKPP